VTVHEHLEKRESKLLQSGKTEEEIQKEKEQMKAQKKHVMMEIITTEQAFVEDMDAVVKVKQIDLLPIFLGIHGPSCGLRCYYRS
jgi:hypothetical protein